MFSLIQVNSKAILIELEQLIEQESCYKMMN